MPSFQELRDMAVISYSRGHISREACLVLLDEYSSKNPDFSYDVNDRFELDNIGETECKYNFRVEKGDIPVLVDILNLPDVFRCSQRTVSDKTEALCMLLKRAAYPCRYNDMIPYFGRPVPEISMITNTVIDYLYDTHGHRVTQWNNQFFAPDKLEVYAESIRQKGAALDNCFGFIDGTVRPICRPSKNQRIVYNGHKRIHALKFQAVSLPNGLIGNIYGPVGKVLWVKEIHISHIKISSCLQ